MSAVSLLNALNTRGFVIIYNGKYNQMYPSPLAV